MRLFVAVDVDQATRQAARAVRARVARQGPAIERALKWVDANKLHLTLRFIGEHDDVALLENALGGRFASPRFSLAWGQLAWLPPRGRPRVFHVAVADGEEALRAVAGEVGDRLAACGIAPEERPFTAHLTLARVRDHLDPGLVRQLASLVPRDPFAEGVRVEVADVVLYESQLSPQGPTYVARRRFALG